MHILVGIFSMFLNKELKGQYLSSLKASLSFKEYKDLLKESKIKGLVLKRNFLTHVTIEKNQKQKLRNYKIPSNNIFTAIGKSFYS